MSEVITRLKYGPFPPEQLPRVQRFAEKAKALGFTAAAFNDFEREEVFAVAVRFEPERTIHTRAEHAETF